MLSAVPVATLFGSLSPTVEQDDVRELVDALRKGSRPDRLQDKLDTLADAAQLSDVAGLPEGQPGANSATPSRRCSPRTAVRWRLRGTCTTSSA